MVIYGTCGQIYKDGKLSVKYPDVNKDGISDVILEGKANIVCEEERMADDVSEEYEDVQVSEVPVNKIYLWDKNNRVFAESI